PRPRASPTRSGRCARRARPRSSTSHDRLGRRVPDDPPGDAAQLPPQAAAVVRLPMAGGGLPPPPRPRPGRRGGAGGGDGGRGGEVGEQVVLDLMAEVPGQDLEQLPAVDVRRPVDLSQVPAAAALVARFLLAVHPHAVGKMPAEDDRERPQVAHHVGEQIAGEDAGRVPQRQRRVEDVVLRQLPAGLAQERPGPRPQLRARLLSRQCLVETEVVRADPPLETERQQRGGDRLDEVRRVPALLGPDPEERVADVAVLSEDVGEGVVLVVVGVPPTVAGADDVPLVGARIEVGVPREVVLAVENVVPDLHVLEDLGGAEGAAAEGEAGGPPAEAEEQPAAGLGITRGADHPPDVVDVSLAEVGDHVLPERVELAAERVGLFRGQGLAGVGHDAFPHRPSSTSEQGTEMQSWMSSSVALDSAPVSTFFTVPARLRQRQVWQIPMRQPYAGRSPARSSCSSRLPDAVAGKLRPDRASVTMAPAPAAGAAPAPQRSPWSSDDAPARSQAHSARAIRPGGPQRKVSRSAKSGTRAPSCDSSNRPKRTIKRRPRWRAASAARAREKITSSCERAWWTNTRSPIASRAARSRSIDMTGVMPLPPLRKSRRPGAGSGRTKSPAAGPRRTR